MRRTGRIWIFVSISRTQPPRILRWGIIAFLLIAYAALGVSAAATKSATFDEMPSVMSGLSYWMANDFRLDPENGILPQRWMALPVLLGPHRFPMLDQESWRYADPWRLGYQFFYKMGNDPAAILFRARTMVMFLGMALGLLVYFWSSRLFGFWGGALSLALYVFCPTTLAHGNVATTDMAAALFFIASLWCLWSLMHRFTWAHWVGGCLAMAGLFLSKYSAILIVPIGLLLSGIRLAHAQRRTRVAAAILAGWLVQTVVVFALVWGAYGFRYSVEASDQSGASFDYPVWIGRQSNAGPFPAWLDAACDERVLPQAYLVGLGQMLTHSQKRVSFLNGHYGLEGWWSFFPYTFFAKTPISFLAILFLLAILVGIRWRRKKSLWPDMERTAPLWVFIAVYGIFSLWSHLNIGHRHILPIYPALFILAGGVTLWMGKRQRFVTALVLFALTASALEAVRVWPDYLAYFNPLFGGSREGYRHLVDSSLDWGQDLPALKQWLDRHGLSNQEETKVYLSYFGSASPEHYGIRSIRLPGFSDGWREETERRLTGGVYCISASIFQAVYGIPMGPWAVPYEKAYRKLARDYPAQQDPVVRAQMYQEFERLRLARLCSFLRQRPPDDRAGYSILIYRVTDEEARRAVEGPPVELRPDVAVAFHRGSPE